jgi:tryptophan-rich sensory protein
MVKKMESSKLKEIPKLVASILIPLIIGFLGSIATMAEIPTWYAALSKPSWAPPNWLFGPVWTTLYVLMGISLYLVWREGLDRLDVRFAILIFAVQLLLNLLWSIVFFSYHALFGSFILILILWISILANIIAFYVISKPAGILLVPYIVWVSIASYLNYSVYILNP